MDIYGLVGYPLTHSFSRDFFTDKFAQENIAAAYLNFEIGDISLFPSIIADNPTLRGLNVTIPYKEKIIPFLDNLDPRAEEIGAINVIKVLRKGNEVELTGYNSDVIGFQDSIAPLINRDIHTKALILGTGGASKAVYKGLKDLSIGSVYVSRTPGEGRISYQDLDENVINEYKVIVNASPIGTFPDVDEAPGIPYHLLTGKHLLYDLVYNPAETKFLKSGKQQGAVTKNGAEMLELQARAAWKIWNG
jgi:shikimate dehydrogenase